MSTRKLNLYLLAWGAYIAASMLGYPYLRITVMLFSVPLTMLGGWFYSYKGALITTALTIPYHYLLLSVHSDDPAVLIEAINPFGIASLVVFSLGSALLRSIEQRYHKLNTDLEQIVAERTNDLQQLTEYLINMQYIDRSIITSGLLDNPLELLESMQETSSHLCKHLDENQHAEVGHAKIVHKHIQQCMEKLTEFMDEAKAISDPGETLREKTQKLSEKMMHLGREGLSITVEGNWKRLDIEVTHELFHIISEAVANAVRHAKATEIMIACRHDPLSTTICVTNNGETLPDQPQEGMGLPLMRHRARSIGGTLTMKGGTGQRTRVSCSVPHTATADEKAFPGDRQRLNTTA